MTDNGGLRRDNAFKIFQTNECMRIRSIDRENSTITVIRTKQPKKIIVPSQFVTVGHFQLRVYIQFFS